MPGKGFIDKAYSDDGIENSVDFYDEWATGYEADVLNSGYLTIGRCAEALARADPRLLLGVRCGPQSHTVAVATRAA